MEKIWLAGIAVWFVFIVGTLCLHPRKNVWDRIDRNIMIIGANVIAIGWNLVFRMIL